MKAKKANQTQRDFFKPLLTDFIDLTHELILLSNKIDWNYFEQDFAKYYSHTGQPAISIRLMVGTIIFFTGIYINIK
jgi:IS5 family transposase